MRAQIVLAYAGSGAVNEQVAADLGVIVVAGLVGLTDAGRSVRPKAKLELTGEERQQLTRWARRVKSAQALALRAKIVLACAEGK